MLTLPSSAPSKAVKFDKTCIACVEDSAREIFGKEYHELTEAMTSGAGHDSVVSIFHMIRGAHWSVADTVK